MIFFRQMDNVYNIFLINHLMCCICINIDKLMSYDYRRSDSALDKSYIGAEDELLYEAETVT